MVSSLADFSTLIFLLNPFSQLCKVVARKGEEERGGGGLHFLSQYKPSLSLSGKSTTTAANKHKQKQNSISPFCLFIYLALVCIWYLRWVKPYKLIFNEFKKRL